MSTYPNKIPSDAGIMLNVISAEIPREGKVEQVANIPDEHVGVGKLEDVAEKHGELPRFPQGSLCDFVFGL